MSAYKSGRGWRLMVEHGAQRIDVASGVHGAEPPEFLFRVAKLWAASVVADKDTRADIDKLGAAVGIDTKGGKKADALKALRSGR